MSKSQIGSRCNIGQNVVISPEVKIGNSVKIQNNVSIYTGVTIEDEVFIGPSAVFTNILNPRSNVSRRGQFVKTLVKRGATIGANATVICGITIGEFSFVGAGCVVTKDVPAYALVFGNPGVQKGWMSELGHKLEFDENRIAVCPESQQQYTIKEDIVTRVV
jgi:UDP-2-acetamido-3-amino-2,3-dideoxy-glucuronate N-acetyltransferase